jgi:hypothetical protein
MLIPDPHVHASDSYTSDSQKCGFGVLLGAAIIVGSVHNNKR